MRLKALFAILFMILSQKAFAVDTDLWILWDTSWVTAAHLRTWDIHTDDIPRLIISATDFLLSIAWTIAIVFIIIGSYQMLFWSLSSQKSAGRDTIVMALIWFGVATLSYFIIRLITDNVADFV